VYEAEADAARRMLFGLAGDICVAALLGGGQIFAHVARHVAQGRLAMAGVPAQSDAQGRLGKAIEACRSPRRGRLGDARLEADEVVAVAGQGRIDIGVGGDVENVGVGLGPRHDERMGEVDLHVAGA
jgi:hypothetical protein